MRYQARGQQEEGRDHVYFINLGFRKISTFLVSPLCWEYGRFAEFMGFICVRVMLGRRGAVIAP